MVKVDRVKVRTKRAGKRKMVFHGKMLHSSESVNIVNSLPSLSVNNESFVNNKTDIFDTSSSSFHKVEPVVSSTPQQYTRIKNKDVTGYRIIYCSILSNVISVLSCPTCFETTFAINENKSKKQGLACELSISCSKCK